MPNTVVDMPDRPGDATDELLRVRGSVAFPSRRTSRWSYAETMWWRHILWDLFGHGANSKLAAMIAVGYLLGAPVLAWCSLYLQRLYRPRWVGDGNRDQWQLGAVVTYLALGWPVVLFAMGWWTSRTRADLLAEHARRTSRPNSSPCA